MNGKVIVVTGANKGIGYGIVRGLARQLQGAIIYLTARNPSLGREALEKLAGELGDKAAQVRFHQLDISDAQSCRALADHLAQEHRGLDVLVNNAGFAFKHDATESAAEQAEVTIGINYYATKQVSNTLIPLIRSDGRIVTLCSQMGIMKNHGYSAQNVAIFDRNDFTEADIDAFVEQYKKLAAEGRRKEGGFPESAYMVSKAAEIALSQLMARQLAGRNIAVHACCPGYVDTDMTSHKGHLSLDQGAETPIYLATTEGLPSGKFWYKKAQKDWLREEKNFSA